MSGTAHTASSKAGRCVPGATDIRVKIEQMIPSREDRPLPPTFYQNQLKPLKVFTMHQTDVTASALSPVPTPTFASAAIRFIASFGVLIAVSLLLASL